MNDNAHQGATIRNTVQDRLGLAREVALGSTTVFCVQPYDSLSGGNEERLGSLMARVMADPDHALIVATDEAFVFAFAGTREPAPQQVNAIEVPLESSAVPLSAPNSGAR